MASTAHCQQVKIDSASWVPQQCRMRNSRRGVVVLVMLMLGSPVQANPAGSGSNTPAIMADVLIARPLGLMAMLGGTALYVISLPFTLPTRSNDEAQRTLIEYPYHYTFTRPVGDFD